MEVAIVEATEEPEELVCKAARNDYMTEWVGEMAFEDVMASIDGDSLEEKKENLLIHLMRRAHFGPFEHPHATFSVTGVSRITMAQITRHRHATFDIQSLRYTKPDLGVTSDPRVRTLPPGFGEKRAPDRRYDVNQEAAVAAWRDDGVADAVLAAVLGVDEDAVAAMDDARDRDGEGDGGGDEDDGGGAENVGDAGAVAADAAPSLARVQGLLAAAGDVDDGVVRVDLPARERGYAAAVAAALDAPGNVFSLDGETVTVAVRVADAPDAAVAAARGDVAAIDELDPAGDAAFLLGVVEGVGGFEGDRLALHVGDEAPEALAGLLEREVGRVERWRRGDEAVLTVDATALADAVYGDAAEFASLHRGRLLGAMDASERVAERFRAAVDDWLDGQQFVYPPSVREEEIVSREAGRIAFDAAPWRRIEEIRGAYERQAEHYNRLLAQGVPAEDARAVLGMGITVNITFTMNARALMHLFDMRAAGDAQWEARELSGHLIELSKDWMPTTFEYYDEEMKGRKNRLGP